MCENLSALPNRLQRFSSMSAPLRRPTKELAMQVSMISDDIAAQATIVNRFAGSVRAWTLLVRQGYDCNQVFEFLAKIEDPEDTPSSSATLME